MADVSSEALEMTRNALKEFGSKAASICQKARRDSDTVLEECRAELKVFGKEVDKSDMLVKKITVEKHAAEVQLAELNAELVTAISNAEGRKSVSDIHKAIKDQKNYLEAIRTKLEEERLRNIRLHDKQERLKSIFRYMQNDADDYMRALSAFSLKERDRTVEGVSAVKKCLEEINNYLSLNI